MNRRDKDPSIPVALWRSLRRLSTADKFGAATFQRASQLNRLHSFAIIMIVFLLGFYIGLMIVPL